MWHYFKEQERDEDIEVGEVVEVQDNQSVASLKSNDSDLKKKTNDDDTKEKGGWTNALILLGTLSMAYFFDIQKCITKSYKDMYTLYCFL